MTDTKINLRTARQAHRREQIITVLTDPAHDGKTQQELADLVGIHRRTLQRYLTPALWVEVKQRRLAVVHNALQKLDDVVYQQALDGDLAAAKIIYTRWDELAAAEKAVAGEGADLPNDLAALDEQIAQLQAQLAKSE